MFLQDRKSIWIPYITFQGKIQKNDRMPRPRV